MRRRESCIGKSERERGDERIENSSLLSQLETGTRLEVTQGRQGVLEGEGGRGE